MSCCFFWVLLSAWLVVGVQSDCYLHYFRGSNNRLNEQSANRNNANRLFDSQNNNRGGYNCCDLDPINGFDDDSYMASASQMYDWTFLHATNNDNTAQPSSSTYRKQYEEIYFEESIVSVTWTNQHGTGNQKLLSQMILQFGCDNYERPTQTGSGNGGSGPDIRVSSVSFPDGSSCQTPCQNNLVDIKKHGLRMELMNGGNTNAPSDPNSISDISSKYDSNNANDRGRHESEEFYYLCEQRQRNNGLFHADQNLRGWSQIYTRQNPNGNRRGLECPEERDYYPWWNPSPWHDIAIITPNVEYCEAEIAPNSQNVANKCTCSNPSAGVSDNDVTDWFPENSYVEYNLNEAMCEANGGDWDCFKWNVDPPECVESYWSQVNYLGNVDGTTRGGKQAHYDWTLPSYDDLRDDHSCYPYEYIVSQSSDSSQDTSSTINCIRMVFRIRYNMSTMDYDPYTTNYMHDYDEETGILSPIEQNPEVDVGFYAQGLQLAINTAQTGRTFQDRSHTFLVCERPSAANGKWSNSEVYNVNVRGKRGNIVQTFPATEYDFEPQHLEITPGTCMHFQWCGSNTHNNGAPAGDGQAGDAGEGRGGSDRSNLVQVIDMDQSYPLAYDNANRIADGEGEIDEGFDGDFFDYVNCYHPLQSGIALDSEDAQLILGTAGFYRSVEYMEDQCLDLDDEDCIIDELLNNVSASFRVGLICCVKNNVNVANKNQKHFAFISTRNNNFTNRSQKLKIVICHKDDCEDSKFW